MFIDLIKFIIFIFLFVYLPSCAIFRLLKIDIKDYLVSLNLKIITGIFLLTVITLMVEFFNIPMTVLYLFSIASIVILNIKKKPVKSKGKKLSEGLGLYIPVLFLILLLTVLQNVSIGKGGLETAEGVYFPSISDTMWNIALTEELINHFPPQHPGMSGEMLKNNHFFYPLFLSVVSRLTKINMITLYYRLAPLFMSFLFGLSLYQIGTIFTSSTMIRSLIIFFGYMSGNFAYLIPLFMRRNFAWYGNSFFADQPFDQLINPYTVFGFTIYLTLIYLMNIIIGKGEKKVQLVGIFSLLAGFSFGFKSFTGIIFLLSFFIYGIYYLVKYKSVLMFKIIPFALIFFVPLFLFIAEPGKASLFWAPGWLLTQMMTNEDKLNLSKYALIENYYRDIHNYLGLLKIKTFEFLIYFFGNLGTRISGLMYIFWILIFQKNRSQKIHVFILISCITGLAIPVFFNLGGNAYNIIQFTPYALLLLAIMTGLMLGRIIMKIKNVAFAGFVIIAFVGLTVPVTIKNIIVNWSQKGEFIDRKIIQSLNWVKVNTFKDEILLIDPSQFTTNAIYVPALSGRRVYLASSGHAGQILRDPKPRLAEIKSFYANPQNRSFLKENRIKYIYYIKDANYQSFAEKLKTNKIDLIFENSKAAIFKI